MKENEFMKCAKAELALAKLAAGHSSHSFYDMIAGFHLKQAAVFMLKAGCVYCTGVQPDTDDISDLIDILKEYLICSEALQLDKLYKIASELELVSAFYMKGEVLDTFTDEVRVNMYSVVKESWEALEDKISGGLSTTPSGWC